MLSPIICLSQYESSEKHVVDHLRRLTFDQWRVQNLFDVLNQLLFTRFAG